MADLIDRAALLAQFADLKDKAETLRDKLYLDGVMAVIDTQATIDPPVVHAKWVVNTDDFTPKKRCTNCGYNKAMKAGEGIEQEPEAFCPSCGATMDENGGNSQ